MSVTGLPVPQAGGGPVPQAAGGPVLQAGDGPVPQAVGGEPDRAAGALWGLAYGDAMGMPTQTWSRAHIARVHGAVEDLTAARPDQPVAHGMPAGSVTDDTEQALLVGRLLVAGGGHVAPRVLADALVAWEADMRRRNADDLLGPSSRRAIEAILAGVPPEESGRSGHTNGAAMRIAPVGIAVPARPVEDLVDRVREVSAPTHDTGVALAGAAMVAALVSSGVAGAQWSDSLAVALAAGRRAERCGQWWDAPSVPARTEHFLAPARRLDDDAFADLVVEVVGTSVLTQESVVAAVLIADRHREDLPGAARLAASLGGDTDTMGAIACACVGAHLGVEAVPAHARSLIARVSRIDPGGLVRPLLALRGQA